MKQKVNLPEFTADSAVKTSKTINKGNMIRFSENTVVPQDCGFFKKIGCTFGPFSWCALASLGGTVPYWNCVDKASGGNCLDCLTGNDPRDNQPDRSMDGSAGVNEKGKFVGGGSQALSSSDGNNSSDIDTQLTAINKKLNKIERCACGPDTLIYNNAASVWSNILHETYTSLPYIPTPPQPYSMY